MKNEIAGKTMPKHRGDLRQGIINNISAIKDTQLLQEIYIMTDIIRRSRDDKEYATLTDAEWDIWVSVRDILCCDNDLYLLRIRSFVHNMVADYKGRKGGNMA